MISSLLMEAALRSVLLALAVWLGLRIFAVRNVLAQKVAWGLVLASAMAMPIVLPMTEHWSVLPANVRVVIPADPETLLEELQARIQAKSAPEIKPSAVGQGGADTASDAEAGVDRSPVQENRNAQPSVILQASADADDAVESDPAAQYPAAAISQSSLSVKTWQPARTPLWRMLTPLQLAGLVYLVVAAVLCARLLYGLIVTLQVWRLAKPVLLERSVLTEGMRLRVSDSVSSPVTIGSAVLLPGDYREWDSEKLRIVLAHERSHVRQGDFYLQLLAGVYSAVVWFSPLGWWLKRKLSDLAEAISDRAGLEEAADRAAYAQILLEFAAAPRPTTIGVAMARHGSLSRRIERLLNDVSFSQAFAGTRSGLVAVVVVPLALFVATALVRVEAATGQEPQEQIQPVPPASGVVAPQEPAAPAELQEGSPKPEQVVEMPAPAVAPQVPSTGVTPKAGQNFPPDGVMALPTPAHAPAAPAGVPVPPARVPAVPGVAPAPPAHGPAVVILDGKPGVATLAISPKMSLRTPLIVVPRVAYAPAHVGFGEGYGYGAGQTTSTESGTVTASSNGKKSGYRYWSSNGDSYAIVCGNGKENLTFSGNWTEGWHEQIDKARKQADGRDFLWFTREGKAYFVDDPATLAQIESMYKPMEDLGRQQEALGKQQEELGKQQEELGKQQENASVPTPDMSKEIAKIEEAMAKLKASQGKNMTQDEFGDLQEKLGELQARLGEIQGRIGEKQGEFGTRMGELGQRMGELGSQMGDLGARQGKMAQDADQRVRSIIEESLKNGRAHLVQ